MAQLPNEERAVIDTENKLRGYSLNPDHPDGQHKARVFHAVLGLTQDDAPYLEEAIREGIRTGEAQPRRADAYGQRYEVVFPVMGRNGAVAEVTTAWIVRTGEDFPFLISCYIQV